MIKFLNIKWRNFLSTGDSFTTIDFEKHKLTLINGENGAGKTTLLDAICFALYNKPYRPINKPLLINSINKKNLLVEINFRVGSNLYKISRGMKPNIFEIYKNGDLVNQDAANLDYQEFLEKNILKLNYKSFCQVVILGSTSFVPFMQLPTGQRREVIEDLLDLQIFTVMNSLLKEKSKTTESTLRETDYQLDVTQEKISIQQKYLNDLNTDTVQLMEEVETKLQKSKKQIGEEIKVVESNNTKKNELIVKMEDLHKFQSKFDSLKDIQSKLVLKIEHTTKEIGFFKNHENCPTCKQDIDEQFRNLSIEEREGLLNKSNDGMSQLKDEIEKVQTSLKEMNDIQNQISDLNIQNATRISTLKGLEEQIKDYTKQLTNLSEKKTAQSDSSTLKELEEKLEKLYTDKSTLLEKKNLESVASSMLKDSGIKSLIIKQYVPVINKLINKYLAAMDFFVNFTLDETFSETIKSRFRDDFSYHSFSEGEKTRINLAILFTWRTIAKMRNSAATNLLIFDEVLDSSTDQQGIESFFSIIREVTGDTNVFVISHTQSTHESKFDNIIRFRKEKNFSKMVSV